MSERLRIQIAEAFRQEEASHPVPPGLRDDVVTEVVDRRQHDREGNPRLLMAVAILVALGLIATLVGLRRMQPGSVPAAKPPPPAVVSPAPSPSQTPTPTPTARTTAGFTEATLTSRGPGTPVMVAFTETQLEPGQSIWYHVTGEAALIYRCSSGVPQVLEAQGPVDFRANLAADGQGNVTAMIPMQPPAPSQHCSSPGSPSFVSADWRNFVVEDTTNGIRKSAGGLNIST